MKKYHSVKYKKMCKKYIQLYKYCVFLDFSSKSFSPKLSEHSNTQENLLVFLLKNIREI